MYSERKKRPDRDDSLNCLVGWSRQQTGKAGFWSQERQRSSRAWHLRCQVVWPFDTLDYISARCIFSLVCKLLDQRVSTGNPCPSASEQQHLLSQRETRSITGKSRGGSISLALLGAGCPDEASRLAPRTFLTDHI